jgi:hypothetical protein
VTLGLLAALALATPALAQLEGNLGGLTAENAKGYLSPLPKALSGTLNSSIFQSASIPVAGFNFSVGVCAMGVVFDDDTRKYTPKDPPGFEGVPPIQAPTVIGDPGAVTQTNPGNSLSISYPGGLDIDQFVLGVPQLTIGSVAGTKATVRWIAVDLGDSEIGSLNFFGVGAQHSLSRYFPGLPVDLAAGVMYQSLKLGDDDLVKCNALQFGINASKRYAVLEPYAGLGFDTFSMESNYENDTTGDDLNVEFDTESNVHFTAGIQLRLPILRLFAEYNVAAENGAALGLHFGN